MNGGLTKEVYIKQHEGFQVKGQERKVCRLQKMLYGLRQAPHAWYTKINIYLHNQGLIQSEANANAYFSMKEARSCCQSYTLMMCTSQVVTFQNWITFEVKSNNALK